MTETNTLDRGTIAEGVIGAWRLVSYVVEDAEGGHRSFPLGDDAHGIIIYTQSGHMSVQIGSTGRGSIRTVPRTAAPTPNALQPPRVIWPMQAGTPCPTRA